MSLVEYAKNLKMTVCVGMSNVMRCLGRMHVSRMYVNLNGESLEKLDCFKFPKSGTYLSIRSLD